MVSRKNKVLTDADIEKITQAYHSWRNKGGNYTDIQGFCKAATLNEIEANNFVLTPGRYVGTEEVEDDGVSFDEKVASITLNLKEHFQKSIELQENIKNNLKKIGLELK
jgi:type I restriction enzyme M protein